MNRASLSIDVEDVPKTKKSIEESLQGNERVNMEVKEEDDLQISIEAQDMTSFRGSLNSALRLTKLANKILS